VARKNLVLGLGLLLITSYWLVCWPYLLGTWIAVELGAGPQSATRVAVGCAAQAIYVVAAPLLVALIRGWRPLHHRILRRTAHGTLGTMAAFVLVAAALVILPA
jgi:hypothetical protein